MQVRRRSSGPLLAIYQFWACVINEDRSFRSSFVEFLYVAEGIEFSCMLLRRIIFLIMINLVEPVKFKPLVVFFALSAVGI